MTVNPAKSEELLCGEHESGVIVNIGAGVIGDPGGVGPGVNVESEIEGVNAENRFPSEREATLAESRSRFREIVLYRLFSFSKKASGGGVKMYGSSGSRLTVATGDGLFGDFFGSRLKRALAYLNNIYITTRPTTEKRTARITLVLFEFWAAAAASD